MKCAHLLLSTYLLHRSPSTSHLVPATYLRWQRGLVRQGLAWLAWQGFPRVRGLGKGSRRGRLAVGAYPGPAGTIAAGPVQAMDPGGRVRAKSGDGANHA